MHTMRNIEDSSNTFRGNKLGILPKISTFVYTLNAWLVMIYFSLTQIVLAHIHA
ncbi:Uncharacterised protein [Yersinia nurmii]|uniref:Uncharacterized protein n=1 Tax=Yersinia nurmii TaxID=685706 RepID=A0ABM9S4J5_9GAMM|nr:Uncharacterised protein [Yersinia nurmii]